MFGRGIVVIWPSASSMKDWTVSISFAIDGSTLKTMSSAETREIVADDDDDDAVSEIESEFICDETSSAIVSENVERKQRDGKNRVKIRVNELKG